MYGYNERKAAQVTAFFAIKSGGRINVLKLAKLLYLAERKCMELYDEPMFFDKLVSMDHGPVTSISLNNVNGMSQSPSWPEFIAGREANDIRAVDGIDGNSFDELSKADVRILTNLWETFGGLDRYALRDWTHENCPEWENPHGSSQPIPHDRVFKFLGKKNANFLAEAIASYRAMSGLVEEAC